MKQMLEKLWNQYLFEECSTIETKEEKAFIKKAALLHEKANALMNRAQEIAESIGMWLNTYRNYETGKREPPFDFVIALARYYNVSLDYLAGLIDDPQKLNRFETK